MKEKFYSKKVSSDLLGQQLAEKHKVPFIEASAYDGTNVEFAFHKIAELVIQKGGKGHVDSGPSGDKLSDKIGKKLRNKKCCKN